MSGSTPSILVDIPGMAEAAAFIRSRYLVDSIYIFGSFARGEARVDSDIDICVTLLRAEKRILDIMVDLHAGLSAILERSIDVVVYDKKVFDERREAGASFEKTIAAEGIAV
ncbi:MAG: nucleotidyltransferase domain-containing protein [Spirochaetes bacterium]|nr:nucleotidyltransferase domain-containing protein [Spirochaetota bacterium]